MSKWTTASRLQANAKLLDAASRGDIKEVEELLSHGTRTEAPGSKVTARMIWLHNL